MYLEELFLMPSECICKFWASFPRIRQTPSWQRLLLTGRKFLSLIPCVKSFYILHPSSSLNVLHNCIYFNILIISYRLALCLCLSLFLYMYRATVKGYCVLAISSVSHFLQNYSSVIIDLHVRNVHVKQKTEEACVNNASPVA